MSDPIIYEGKKLYRIDVYRTASDRVWVLADDEDAAIEDAKELACDLDFIDSDDDYTARTSSTPPHPGVPIWTGGPDGSEIFASDLSEVPS